jgi:hypothetical protein
MTISLTSTVLRYGIAPADKSLSYAIFEAPWMILTWICLYLPPVFPIWPITLVAWFWCATPSDAAAANTTATSPSMSSSRYFLCIITVQDEFTLFNFIASFKALTPLRIEQCPCRCPLQHATLPTCGDAFPPGFSTGAATRWGDSSE